VVACWGLGRALLARIGAPARRDLGLEPALAMAAGLGIAVCLLQALAIAHALSAAAVCGILGVGAAAALLQWPVWRREVDQQRLLRWTRAAPGVAAASPLPPLPPPFSRLDKMALGILLLLALPVLVAPLAPPAVFDELMYHLPYAREVAKSGALCIDEWLRYPWFPYNVNLLFAAALQVGDDVLPHFVSLFAGGLTIWMVYRLGLRHASRLTGLAAAAIWLCIGDFATALIDTGVALFVLSACVALWNWRESLDDAAAVNRAPRWLALAAFFLGLAAGAKYQALTALPLVALFVVRRERRPRVWALALLCFLIPCIYWYARNALSTGDPFNPIGARLFGFTNWNAADYKNQIDDVRAHAAWPNGALWGVLFVPFGLAWKRSPAVRSAAIFCAYSLLVWVLTSRYPRYLTASMPLLALMAVAGWQALFAGAGRAVQKAWPGWRHSNALDLAGRSLGVLLMAFTVGVSFYLTRPRLEAVAVTPEERSAYLAQKVPGYGVMDYLRQHATGRVYQVALSEAIYYGPVPVWGDTIGPWRYSDYIALPPAQAARKLRGLGFEAIAVAAATVPVLEAQPGFLDHFAVIHEDRGAKAYRILPESNDRPS
jgi:4-amino-4-deoxy-L-arabinose transferase-like glycosyltransferase